ncbi:BatD family protein [Tenacibaculum sp. S7007]|uniref:BatD family protein n=1 Tax=Tenacibaculum pelagium TaxID=2759527 RepID=A0A839ANL2_9FLAO|nr:BatD family protein [Tenacibaculum pelagium]MBA6156086.1 BatD family protein [Tenacibaculum pelagium]
MKKKFSFIFLTLIFITLNTITAQVKFKINVNKNKIDIKESLKVDFIINKKENNFQAPGFKKFTIVRGPFQSESQSWINGKNTYSKTYTYILTAKKEGKLIIPSATCNIDSKLYKTTPTSIEVVTNKSQVKKNSKVLYTKFGSPINREKFFISCKDQINKGINNTDKKKIDIPAFCSCITDNLVKKLVANDIQDAIENEKILGLLFKNQNDPELKTCFEKSTINSFKLTDFNNLIINKSMYIGCLNQMTSKQQKNGQMSLNNAKKYCSCFAAGFVSKGYTYLDVKKITSQNDEFFNEALIPCLNKVVKKVAYQPNDIIGNSFLSKVPLIEQNHYGYKVKMSIGSIFKYYVFDTGASDVMINKDLEKYLLSKDIIKQEDYLGTKSIILGNDKNINARIVRLNNIKIGDYVVNNVEAAIIDSKKLFFGRSLLNKFKKWQFDSQDKILTLYK